MPSVNKVSARAQTDVSYETSLGDPAFQLVTVNSGQTVAGAIEELEADPAVAVVEHYTYSTPTSIPNDPLFGQEWALENLGAGIERFSGAISPTPISKHLPPGTAVVWHGLSLHA